MKPLLHRYWFDFEPGTLPAGTAIGCGVTAYTKEDARGLLAETVFRASAFPPVRRVVEDVDVSTLDAGHVLPNMLDPVTRGVWFPMGHRHS
jgi:hypothetical protein